MTTPDSALKSVLTRLKARGVTLRTKGRELRAGPAANIDADTAEAIRAHRDALWKLTKEREQAPVESYRQTVARPSQPAGASGRFGDSHNAAERPFDDDISDVGVA